MIIPYSHFTALKYLECLKSFQAWQADSVRLSGVHAIGTMQDVWNNSCLVTRVRHIGKKLRGVCIFLVHH